MKSKKLELKFVPPTVPLFMDDDRWTVRDLDTMTYSLKEGAPPEIVQSLKEWKVELKKQEASGYDY